MQWPSLVRSMVLAAAGVGADADADADAGAGSCFVMVDTVGSAHEATISTNGQSRIGRW